MAVSLLNKQNDRIRRMFGQIAPRYDLLNHLLSLQVDRYWRWRVTRLVPPATEPAPVLDLCTGTGDLALAYARVTPEQTPVIGADFCHEMLCRARRKARCFPGRVHFVEADAQRLPFPSDYFQIVCVAFGLRNLHDADRGLAEMVRVLRPGGRLAVLEFSQPQHRLFGLLYRCYFRYVLPLIGQILSRSRERAYCYLPASVAEFPQGEALASRLRRHGLVEVRWHPLTLGIATLYVGHKPVSSGSEGQT